VGVAVPLTLIPFGADDMTPNPAWGDGKAEVEVDLATIVGLCGGLLSRPVLLKVMVGSEDGEDRCSFIRRCICSRRS
jgi:hypothetical protein